MWQPLIQAIVGNARSDPGPLKSIEKRKLDTYIYRYSVLLYLSLKAIFPWSLHAHEEKQCFTLTQLLVKQSTFLKSYIRDPVGRTKLNTGYNGRKTELGNLFSAFSIIKYIQLRSDFVSLNFNTLICNSSVIIVNIHLKELL